MVGIREGNWLVNEIQIWILWNLIRTNFVVRINQVISQIMNPLVIYLFHFISSGRIWIGVDLSGLGIERVVKLGRFVYFLSKIKFMTSIRNKLSPCQRVEVGSLFFLYLVVYYCTGLWINPILSIDIWLIKTSLLTSLLIMVDIYFLSRDIILKRVEI